MVEIINLDDLRPKAPDADYTVRIDLLKGKVVGGSIGGLGEALSADDLRTVADDLAALARLIRVEAAARAPDPDRDVLAEVTICRSSRVQVWVGKDVETPAQVDWLSRRLEDAKAITAP